MTRISRRGLLKTGAAAGVLAATGVPVMAMPKRGGTLDIQALAEGPLIEEATFRLWPAWFRCAGLDDVPELNLPHPLGALLAIQSAVAGLGAVLMDKNLCEPERQSGALVELADVELEFGGYYLIVNGRAGRRKAVRAVCRWLLRESAETQAIEKDP